MTRPSTYRSEHAATAFQAAMSGATNAEIAKVLEVSEQSVYRWRKQYADFRKALDLGSEACQRQRWKEYLARQKKALQALRAESAKREARREAAELARTPRRQGGTRRGKRSEWLTAMIEKKGYWKDHGFFRTPTGIGRKYVWYGPTRLMDQTPRPT